MKKVWSMILLVILVLLVTAPSIAVPLRVLKGNAVIPHGKNVVGDLYFQGDYLEIAGEVHGDVLVMAREVRISGKIDGNLIGVAWERMAISGTVKEDLRVLAGQLFLSGEVGESLSAAALRMDLGPKSSVNKGILGLFNEVNLAGLVRGPIRISGYSGTQIGGHIGGDLQIHGVPVKWSKGVQISGNINDYTGITDTSRSNGIKMSGDYRIHQDNEFIMKIMKSLIFISVIWLLGSILMGLIIYKLFPRTSWRISQPGKANFRKYFLSGLAGSIGIPILIVLLVLTRVGIPFAILLGFIYILLLLFSNIPLYLWVGRIIYAKARFDIRRRPTLLIITGGLVLTVLGVIPFVGYFLQIMGFGMIVGNIRFEIDGKPQIDLQA